MQPSSAVAPPGRIPSSSLESRSQWSRDCFRCQRRRRSDSTFQLCVPNGATPEDSPLGEAEARYAVVRLIDGLRDVATPAGPTPRKLTQPTGLRAANAVRPRRRKGARAMLADFGLLLRALGEQHLSIASTATAAAARDAQQPRSDPLPDAPLRRSADGRGSARRQRVRLFLCGEPVLVAGAHCRRPAAGSLQGRLGSLPLARGLGSASGRRPAFRALSITGSPQGGNPR